MFLEQVTEQLSRMSETEKEKWILSQAKLRKESEQDDLTDVYIYLLVDSKKSEDKDRYKKLYSSAKRRRAADIIRIDEALKHGVDL